MWLPAKSEQRASQRSDHSVAPSQALPCIRVLTGFCLHPVVQKNICRPCLSYHCHISSKDACNIFAIAISTLVPELLTSNSGARSRVAHKQLWNSTNPRRMEQLVRHLPYAKLLQQLFLQNARVFIRFQEMLKDMERKQPFIAAGSETRCR